MGHGDGVGQLRALSQVGEHRLHVLTSPDHKVPALAPRGDHSHRHGLTHNELGNRAVQVGVHAPTESSIGADYQNSNPLDRPYLKEGMHHVGVVSRLGGQVSDHVLNFFRKRPPLGYRLLRPAHLGRGDQGHGVGNLAGVFHAADAAAYVSYTGHFILGLGLSCVLRQPYDPGHSLGIEPRLGLVSDLGQLGFQLGRQVAGLGDCRADVRVS